MLKQTLGIWDFMVIIAVMVLSVAIGFYFRFTGNRQKTTGEFLMAGKDMSRFPVVFSLVASKLSAIALIGEPSDVYLYGTQRCVGLLFIIIGAYVTAYVYLPVYFASEASTIYGFLEKRFGKHARSLVSFFCYLQILLNMAVVIYTPSLALNSVTNLNTETSILLMGIVCIVFSSMGGLRAIIWADVFQSFLMYACIIMVLIYGTIDAGGPLNVFDAAQKGNRIEFFNFSIDPSIRYTFWNSISYGVQLGIQAHAVNQVEIQRLLAIKDLKNAQSALLWSSMPSFAMQVMTSFVGLVMFAVFQNCDPVSKKSGSGLTKADQIVPYFIVTRLSKFPGLSGLCVSGIFSGSMSSLSSGINSLSVVFLDDFVLPNIPASWLKKINLNFFAKALVVVHGIIIIGLAFAVASFRSVLQGVVVINAMILGPALGLFTLGMLTRRVNEKGGLLGLVVGVLLSGWIGLGSSFKGQKPISLPLSTDGCDTQFSFTTAFTDLQCCNVTHFDDLPSTVQDPIHEPFALYKISYLWINTIAVVCTLLVGYIASLLFDCCFEKEPVDSQMLSPIVRHCRKGNNYKETEISLKDKMMDC